MSHKIIIKIDDHYFDVTDYADKHPGGRKILQRYHMKDGTLSFNGIKGHGETYVTELLKKYEISSNDIFTMASSNL